MALPKLVAEHDGFAVRVTCPVTYDDFVGRQAVLLQFDKDRLVDRIAVAGDAVIAEELGKAVLEALSHPFTLDESEASLKNKDASVDIALVGDSRRSGVD